MKMISKTEMPLHLTDSNSDDVQHDDGGEKQTKVWSKILRTKSPPHGGCYDLEESFQLRIINLVVLTHSEYSWDHAVQDHHEEAPEDLHFRAVHL